MPDTDQNVIAIGIGATDQPCTCDDRGHLHTIYAYVQLAPNGEETIIGVLGVLGPEMMIGYDMGRAMSPSFRNTAQLTANGMSKPVYLRKYVLAQTIETIEPKGHP